MPRTGVRQDDCGSPELCVPGRFPFFRTRGGDVVYMTCALCGGSFVWVERGRRPSYCSASCRARASRLRDIEAYRAANRDRLRLGYAPRSSVAFPSCFECGLTFCARMATAKVCSSPKCRRAHRARTTAERRARQGRENYGYTEATAAAYHRRRALKKGATIEDFKPSEIFERDEWTCGICSEPVDRSLRWPDPLSVSLDHIVPLAQGGAHSRANTQCAHLTCNVRKGAKVA